MWFFSSAFAGVIWTAQRVTVGASVSCLPSRVNSHQALCPDAADYSYSDYGQGTPTTSSPSGGTGHYTELTCTYADGSQKTFPNEEVGLKGIGAAFAVSGICGAGVVAILMIVAAIIGGRLVKPKA